MRLYHAFRKRLAFRLALLQVKTDAGVNQCLRVFLEERLADRIAHLRDLRQLTVLLDGPSNQVGRHRGLLGNPIEDQTSHLAEQLTRNLAADDLDAGLRNRSRQSLARRCTFRISGLVQIEPAVFVKLVLVRSKPRLSICKGRSKRNAGVDGKCGLVADVLRRANNHLVPNASLVFVKRLTCRTLGLDAVLQFTLRILLEPPLQRFLALLWLQLGFLELPPHADGLLGKVSLALQ